MLALAQQAQARRISNLFAGGGAEMSNTGTLLQPRPDLFDRWLDVPGRDTVYDAKFIDIAILRRSAVPADTVDLITQEPLLDPAYEVDPAIMTVWREAGEQRPWPYAGLIGAFAWRFAGDDRRVEWMCNQPHSERLEPGHVTDLLRTSLNALLEETPLRYCSNEQNTLGLAFNIGLHAIDEAAFWTLLMSSQTDGAVAKYHSAIVRYAETRLWARIAKGVWEVRVAGMEEDLPYSWVVAEPHLLLRQTAIRSTYPANQMSKTYTNRGLQLTTDEEDALAGVLDEAIGRGNTDDLRVHLQEFPDHALNRADVLIVRARALRAGKTLLWALNREQRQRPAGLPAPVHIADGELSLVRLLVAIDVDNAPARDTQRAIHASLASAAVFRTAVEYVVSSPGLAKSFLLVLAQAALQRPATAAAWFYSHVRMHEYPQFHGDEETDVWHAIAYAYACRVPAEFDALLRTMPDDVLARLAKELHWTFAAAAAAMGTVPAELVNASRAIVRAFADAGRPAVRAFAAPHDMLLSQLLWTHVQLDAEEGTMSASSRSIADWPAALRLRVAVAAKNWHVEAMPLSKTRAQTGVPRELANAGFMLSSVASGLAWNTFYAALTDNDTDDALTESQAGRIFYVLYMAAADALVAGMLEQQTYTLRSFDALDADKTVDKLVLKMLREPDVWHNRTIPAIFAHMPGYTAVPGSAGGGGGDIIARRTCAKALQTRPNSEEAASVAARLAAFLGPFQVRVVLLGQELGVVQVPPPPPDTVMDDSRAGALLTSSVKRKEPATQVSVADPASMPLYDIVVQAQPNALPGSPPMSYRQIVMAFWQGRISRVPDALRIGGGDDDEAGYRALFLRVFNAFAYMRVSIDAGGADTALAGVRSQNDALTAVVSGRNKRISMADAMAPFRCTFPPVDVVDEAGPDGSLAIQGQITLTSEHAEFYFVIQGPPSSALQSLVGRLQLQAADVLAGSGANKLLSAAQVANTHVAGDGVFTYNVAYTFYPLPLNSAETARNQRAVASRQTATLKLGVWASVTLDIDPRMLNNAWLNVFIAN